MASDNLDFFDSTTKATKTVAYAHNEIHGGSAYNAHFNNTTTSDDDHRTAIAFKTPNTTKWAHAEFHVSASSPAEVFLLEAPTIVATATAGTAVTSFNRNRNSSNVSGILSIDSTPVATKYNTFNEAELVTEQFTGVGTELDSITLAGGTGPRVVGGASRGEHEWVLKQNTIYILYIQNIGANANVHTIGIDWYEHTNK